MKYTYSLPPVRYLLSLAQDTTFPATCAQVTDNAKYWGFSDEVLHFLALFHDNEVFRSRVDFMTRCEELELLINQERDMPQEILRSPQG